MATPKRPDVEIYADPVAKVYEELVDTIMANITAHFDVTDATIGSADWQLARLAEVGALNKQNLETIINAMPAATKATVDALEQAALASLEHLEPSFAAAVKAGYLQNSEYPMMSPRVRDVLNAYQQQAKNALNLVNTTMLNNATASYQKVIAGTVSRVNAAMTNEQSAKVLELLNLKTGEVATGVTTRRDALRQALKELSDEGITGFIDKAGKRWNADTYVNMNLRTTCGNVAMESAFARNRDYGNDLISWPILANARPGCYPWQGKVCSTNNRSGTTTDLNDNTITIYPLNQTTFGEPDGIGGINCHHKPPNIFIPGLSALRGEVPPKKENDAGYENTQTQRALERKVRCARREQAMAEASSDTVAAKSAEDRARLAEKQLKAFTKKEGLTFRRDRISAQGSKTSVKRAPIKPKSAQNPTDKGSGIVSVKTSESDINGIKERLDFDAASELFGKQSGLSYRSYGASTDGMSKWGHAMFADKWEGVQGYGGYSAKWFSVSHSDLVDIKDLDNKILAARKKTKKDLTDFKSMDDSEFLEMFNPYDIVDSAQAWDDDRLVGWFFENVAQPNNILGVKTKDGAIAFDVSIMNRNIPLEVITRPSISETSILSKSEEEALKKAAREAAAAANTPMVAWEKRMAAKHGSSNFWLSLDSDDWAEYYKIGQ